MNEGTSERQCSATTRKGTPCRTRALPGRDYCGLHSPEAVEGRRRGGVNRSNAQRGLQLMPPDLKQVAELVSVAIRQVYDGDLEPRQLSSMAAGTTALCKVLEVALLRTEVDALRDQVAQLVAQRTIEGGSHI